MKGDLLNTPAIRFQIDLTAATVPEPDCPTKTGLNIPSNSRQWRLEFTHKCLDLRGSKESIALSGGWGPPVAGLMSCGDLCKEAFAHGALPMIWPAC